MDAADKPDDGVTPPPSSEHKNPLSHLYAQCNAGDSKGKLANLPEFPLMLDLEMTNTCNFRCLMCPTGNYSQERAKGFMSDEVYYKILEEVAEWEPVPALRFIRWGEPLMHPSIMEYLRAATKIGALTHLNTNGSYLDAEVIEELIDTGLTSLKYSFQGVDQKSYHEMRNIDFYHELAEKMRLFKEIRGDRRYPFLHVSTTITYETPEQVEAYKEEMADLVDEVSVGRTVLDFIDLNAVRLRPDEFEMLKMLKEKESVVKWHPECPEVFDKMSVNWNGEVTACCMDSDSLMLIGDLAKDTVKSIWNSDKLNGYREILADMRHEDLPLCTNCYDTHSLQRPGLQNT